MEERRTTNAIERLHEEFKRRIKTQTVLPLAETAAILFWGRPCARRDPRTAFVMSSFAHLLKVRPA
jgi:transposase-like protein